MIAIVAGAVPGNEIGSGIEVIETKANRIATARASRFVDAEGNRRGTLVQIMQRLGEILIERGVLSLPELHTALETCHRTGGRLGTQLLEYGYVDEPVLLEALSKQLGVPSVLKIKLLHSPLEVRKLLPPVVGRRLLAVPFEDGPRGVKVAMVNPNDRAAMDEISANLQKNVLPHVATETAVLAALGNAESDDADWSAGVEPSTVTSRRRGDDDAWDRLWTRPSFRAAAIFDRFPDPPGAGAVRIATFPKLEEVAAAAAAGYEPPVDDDNFAELIYRADHRDEIGAVVVRYAASLYDRVCLFSVHRGTVAGWMARGRSVVLEDLQSFKVSIEERSLFSDIGPSDSYVGAILDNEANRELIQSLADPAPTEVVAVPIRLKQRVIAFLLCDDPGHPASREHVAKIVRASRKAGVAFEALILRRKLLA